VIFLCQCKDIDGDDDWFSINSHRADWAAEEYIERCESMSGGEMLNDSLKDKEIVRVKDEQGNVTVWEITVDFTKVSPHTKSNPKGPFLDPRRHQRHHLGIHPDLAVRSLMAGDVSRRRTLHDSRREILHPRRLRPRAEDRDPGAGSVRTVSDSNRAQEIEGSVREVQSRKHALPFLPRRRLPPEELRDGKSKRKTLLAL
jgi:hypothetical protein